MAHLCQYCQKPFSRSYNRDRHEKRGCWKRLVEQQGESTTMTTVSPEDVASGVGSAKGSINEDSEDKENHDENMEIDSEDEDDSDLEYDSVDPWEHLRAEVKESLSSLFRKQVERLLEKGYLKRLLKPKLSMLYYQFSDERYGGCTCTISSGSVVSKVIPYTKKL